MSIFDIRIFYNLYYKSGTFFSEKYIDAERQTNRRKTNESNRNIPGTKGYGNTGTKIRTKFQRRRGGND